MASTSGKESEPSALEKESNMSLEEIFKACTKKGIVETTSDKSFGFNDLDDGEDDDYNDYGFDEDEDEEGGEGNEDENEDSNEDEDDGDNEDGESDSDEEIEIGWR